MKTYNGHRSWNAWNVSLWINNNEEMYNHINRLIGIGNNTETIIESFTHFTKLGLFHTKTPDGAVYNKLSLKLAIDAMRE